MVASAWLLYGVRYDALDAFREWQRGPIPEAVSRIDFERAVSRVPSAQAEEATFNDDIPTQQDKNQEAREAEEAGSAELREAGSAEIRKMPEEPEDDNFVQALNLRVPFMIQAPQQIWDDLHGEACEEASSIMLAAYYNDEKEITTEEAESRIMDAVTYEGMTFGYHLDTTADETAQMLREHFEIADAKVIKIDSVDDIKKRLNAGHPVIIPAYGKALGNPNFRNGGPLYHMLVIKGYTNTHFITNDPGTRRGADYVYDFETIWESIHDWNGGDVPNGAKVMISVQ